MKFIHIIWSCCIVLPILLITTENMYGELQTSVSKEKILQILVGNHTRVFSKDDLFEEPVMPQEWYRFLTELKNFVLAQSKGDQKLDAGLNTILENNDALINTLKITYNSLFAKAGDYQIEVIKSSTQKFQQIMSAMQAVQNSLAKETYLYKSKKEARDVLMQVALFTEMTAKKASNDLRKKLENK